MVATRSKARNKLRRRTIDFNKLRESLAGPNSDTRSWVEIGRVDNADDAVAWLDGTGWIADVSFASGALTGEESVPCQVSTFLSGDGEGEYAPVRPGCQVLVAITSGNLNVSPVIIGALHNPTNCPAPSEVNDLPITQEVVEENRVVVTTANLEAQYGDEVRVQAESEMTLKAGHISLAPTDVRDPDTATQAYVRGDEFGTALGNFLDALGVATSTVVTAANAAYPLVAPALPVGVGAALQAWISAVANAMGQLGGGVAPVVVPPVAVPFAASAAGVFKATIADQPVGWKSTKIDGE